MLQNPTKPRLRLVPSRQAGFTLVEMLVVISVIGVLAALLFPTLGRIRLSALKAGTIHNMRQLGIASFQYAADHQNNLPGPTSQGLFKGYTKNTQDQLSNLLAPYLGLPDQESLAPGQSVIVPQLVDPGFTNFNPKAPSSIPHYVQKLGYPSWMSYYQRRPFGAVEQVTDDKKRSLNLLEFANLRPEQRWLLTTVDQQVVGLTASWKNLIPEAPLYGVRFRLYSNGSVSPVAANDAD